jgi:hypothetical protein
MPINYITPKLHLIFNSIQQLRIISLIASAHPMSANLILIHNPALKLLIIAIVAASILHNIVYGKVFQTSVFGEDFAVRGFAYTGRTGDDYVGLTS